MSKPTILVCGALGQIGRVLLADLTARYGPETVLATDLPFEAADLPCRYYSLDATDAGAWAELSARGYAFERVYHLVAVLSAKGEASPWHSWDVNMDSWRNVVEAARHWPGCRVFFPSSIAAYGPPLPAVVDETQVLRPSTSYGISKVAGELWAGYATAKFGVDVRCLRLPGVIGHETMPGGGTTDYAVEIFHYAARGERFRCFLRPDTRLPMIYMDDLVRGIEELMAAPIGVFDGTPSVVDPGGTAAPADRVYNLAGFSVTPAELAAAIRARLPGFEIEYAPDHRQAIAAGWPAALDGSRAREVWGWEPRYDAAATVEAMLAALAGRQASTTIAPALDAGPKATGGRV